MRRRRTTWHTTARPDLSTKEDNVFLLCAEHILCKGCEEQFYNVDFFNVAVGCCGRRTLFCDPCRTHTQTPDLWGGTDLLTVFGVFDMPMEQMQLILNKGSCWGKLNLCRERQIPNKPSTLRKNATVICWIGFCSFKKKIWRKWSKFILLKAAKVFRRMRNLQHISNVSVAIQSFKGHSLWPK